MQAVVFLAEGHDLRVGLGGLLVTAIQALECQAHSGTVLVLESSNLTRWSGPIASTAPDFVGFDEVLPAPPVPEYPAPEVVAHGLTLSLIPSGSRILRSVAIMRRASLRQVRQGSPCPIVQMLSGKGTVGAPASSRSVPNRHRVCARLKPVVIR